MEKEVDLVVRTRTISALDLLGSKHRTLILIFLHIHFKEPFLQNSNTKMRMLHYIYY